MPELENLTYFAKKINVKCFKQVRKVSKVDVVALKDFFWTNLENANPSLIRISSPLNWYLLWLFLNFKNLASHNIGEFGAHNEVSY